MEKGVICSHPGSSHGAYQRGIWMLRFQGRSVKLVAVDRRAVDRFPTVGQVAENWQHVGILGGGQLARMSLAPATALGMNLTVLCRDFGESTSLAWPDVMLGSPDRYADVAAVASRCHVVTFDHELVETANIQALEADGYRFAPSSDVLAIAQSKVLQRERFDKLHLPIPPYTVLAPHMSPGSIEQFGSQHGWPLMVKADRGGYDGRGVWKASSLEEASVIVQQLRDRKISAVLEKMMPLETEVAILVARNWRGELATYPLVETVQIDGMLRSLRAPARVAQRIHDQAAAIARQIASSIEVVGLLAVEFFVTEIGLVVNEVATRPHNSGHYTIEGAVTSQFEQHLRAVLDLPLGSTAMTFPHAVTFNIVGSVSRAGRAKALSIPDAHVHLYGKTPRPGRKLGHVTICAEDSDDAFERAWQAVEWLEGVQK